MRSGMRTLSLKEMVLPRTPSPKEHRAFALCEQLIARRLFFRPSLIDARTTPITKKKQCAHFCGRNFLQHNFSQQPRNTISLDAPHPLCRRLPRLTCAHNARAMSVAASVGLTATFQTAQSNQSAWVLLAVGDIAIALTQTLTDARYCAPTGTNRRVSHCESHLFARHERNLTLSANNQPRQNRLDLDAPRGGTKLFAKIKPRFTPQQILPPIE